MTYDARSVAVRTSVALRRVTQIALLGPVVARKAPPMAPASALSQTQVETWLASHNQRIFELLGPGATDRHIQPSVSGADFVFLLSRCVRA